MKWWKFYPIYLASVFGAMGVGQLIWLSQQFWVIPFGLVAIGLIVAVLFIRQAKKDRMPNRD
jgi:hypothetical protein